MVVVLRGKLASTNQKHYQDLGIVIRHQYEISAFVSQSSFRGETSGDAGECRLFALPKFLLDDRLYFASTDRLIFGVLYFSAIVFETTIPIQ